MPRRSAIASAKQLAVRIESDRRDEPGLRGAEQVAGAANLEIAHGDLQTRAQMRELANRFQARFRVLAERLVSLIEQIAVRLMVRTPDAAAQLVELRQAELVGVVDDHRIDVGNVDSVLDDRRGDENVELRLR